MQKGVYSLLLMLEKDQHIQIGKIGLFLFERGYYVYNGSALGGFGRVKYHLKKDKVKRWHIDYLLDKSKIIKIILSETETNYEHEISKKLAEGKVAKIPVLGFGASDCNKCCPSHLIYFEKIPDIEEIYKKIGLEYALFEEADFKNI